MKLKSGELYWPTTCQEPPPNPPPLEGDHRCDVLVIGSGVTGAMAAYHLSRAGASVMVVDRRALGAGSTPASTALVLYEIDTPLVALAQKLGLERAAAAYRASRRALDDMVVLGRELLDIELAQRPSLYLAARPSHVPRLERETAARRGIGLEVDFLDDRSLTAWGLARPGAIRCDLGLEVNPIKLTRALLAAAARYGARVHPHTEIDVRELGRRGRQRVGFARGSIVADWVVVACGYETPEQFAEVARLTKLTSTYAIATSPLPEAPWKDQALLWDSAHPYVYGRLTADNRVLFGGGDINTANERARDRRIGSKARGLLRTLRRVAPGADAELDFAWAGTFAQTEDGLPYIGAHRNWPRVLFALGYGGNGFTFALIAAQLIESIVRGRTDERLGLFGFERSAKAPVSRAGPSSKGSAAGSAGSGPPSRPGPRRTSSRPR